MVREDRRDAQGEEQGREQRSQKHRIGLAFAAVEQRSERDDGPSEQLHGPDAQNPVMPLSSRDTEGSGHLGLPVRNRSAAYASVIGVVVALLAAGLAIPALAAGGMGGNTPMNAPTAAPPPTAYPTARPMTQGTTTQTPLSQVSDVNTLNSAGLK